MNDSAPAVTAERVLGIIRGVLAYEGVDDRAKIETVALLASADLQTGDLTIGLDDREALKAAVGHVGARS